jgi:hypothetical protein
MYNHPPEGGAKHNEMKTLKLEVGKTYRSRKGEEVKIVRKIESIWAFVGDNEESYNEQGRYYSANWASPYDLIAEVEEVPETSHTFDIPDGVKKVTVGQVGNRIVVEMVPEEVKGPKPGDVMINIHGNVYIFKEVVGSDVHKCYAWAGEGGRLTLESLCFCGHPATPEEAQLLWDALKKAGKRWNAETMQVEEIPEKEQIEEFLKAYADGVIWSREQLRWLIENYLKHKEGEK